MAKVTFRGKVETLGYIDESLPPIRRIKVPRLESRHFLSEGAPHPLSGNAQIFRAFLAREVAKAGVRVGTYLDLDALPERVTVDTSKFLADVTIELVTP